MGTPDPPPLKIEVVYVEKGSDVAWQNVLYQVVANYFGVNKSFSDVPGRTIHWPGGKRVPPPDTPRCGFDGSKCSDEELPKYAIVSGVLSGLVVILCIVFFFIYRRAFANRTLSGRKQRTEISHKALQAGSRVGLDDMENPLGRYLQLTSAPLQEIRFSNEPDES
ncbi:hypothetical protein HPB51_011258 [Rhipicephalus microplus]|uniref:Uncharacterized protein n=1 Tax=Rhipicephalus microplus TaxID=6941 RepID=A0A9J6DML3_RHIMP|nr:hypothetical protein HPB51_011258 [Rhipicephalus microplus]